MKMSWILQFCLFFPCQCKFLYRLLLFTSWLRDYCYLNIEQGTNYPVWMAKSGLLFCFLICTLLSRFFMMANLISEYFWLLRNLLHKTFTEISLKHHNLNNHPSIGLRILVELLGCNTIFHQFGGNTMRPWATLYSSNLGTMDWICLKFEDS